MMMHHRSKSVLRVVGILLGLVVVVVGVKWTGVGAIRAALSRVGVNIAWMIALISAVVIMAAVAAVAAGAARGRLAGKLRWALLVFGVAPIRNGSAGKN